MCSGLCQDKEPCAIHLLQQIWLWFLPSVHRGLASTERNHRWTGCSLNNQYWLPGLIYFRATRAANYRSLGLLDFTLPALEVLSVLCVHSTRTAIKAQLVLFVWLQSQIYWYTFTFMHLADAFYPKQLTMYSGYNFFFYQYVRYSFKMHVGTMIPTITQHLVLVLESDRAAFKECW